MVLALHLVDSLIQKREGHVVGNKEFQRTSVPKHGEAEDHKRRSEEEDKHISPEECAGRSACPKHCGTEADDHDCHRQGNTKGNEDVC